MNRLALLLFVTVLGTHFGYPLLASLAEDPERAARGWFYVLRGVEGVVLFGAILALAWRSAAVVSVCAWGMAEEAMTAVCGASNYRVTIGREPLLAGGLCDGVPVYLAALLALSIGAYAWSRYGR